MMQSKITNFLELTREKDRDCFIIESGDEKGNKMSNGSTDSAVVHTATLKRNRRINDNDDDDDELLATPQGQKAPAIKDVTARKRRRGQIASRKPSNRTRKSKSRTKPVGSSDGVVVAVTTDAIAGIRP
jgi:hypothetical protein